MVNSAININITSMSDMTSPSTIIGTITIDSTIHIVININKSVTRIVTIATTSNNPCRITCRDTFLNTEE